MSYVWINPVVASMYDAYILDEFLRRYGHRRIETTKDWGTIVKEKYTTVVREGKKPVVDMRCPKIREVLTDMDVTEEVIMPDIQPILIHCGKEISERKELEGQEKIITTPCQALADMGNSLGLENTWFVSWNKFVKLVGDNTADLLYEKSTLNKSPIPPGFFEDFVEDTVSLTGESEIRSYFEEEISVDVKLVEALYCKDGCHNGDGVRMSI